MGPAGEQKGVRLLYLPPHLNPLPRRGEEIRWIPAPAGMVLKTNINYIPEDLPVISY
jgi:hypothetical protein